MHTIARSLGVLIAAAAVSLPAHAGAADTAGAAPGQIVIKPTGKKRQTRRPDTRPAEAVVSIGYTYRTPGQQRGPGPQIYAAAPYTPSASSAGESGYGAGSSQFLRPGVYSSFSGAFAGSAGSGGSGGYAQPNAQSAGRAMGR